jgi:hypothetical protein
MSNQVTSAEIVSRRANIGPAKIAGLARKKCVTWIAKNKAPAPGRGFLNRKALSSSG